ncbi:MAG TPA: abortive infection family protein [Candidatus Acidoferrum sp.]|nr:abortive infection family protein [Candidatus Acidoferrum sp.]
MPVTRIKIYDRFSFNTEVFNLVERALAGEWESLKGSAIRYLQAGKYSPDAEDTLRNGGFELWKAKNKSYKQEFEVLYKTAKIPEYVMLEGLFKDARFTWIAAALEKLGHPIWYIAADLDASEEVQSVPVPTLKITSEAVDRALSDAESLIRANGATSGLDRVHTAFHGYLRAVCEEANINFAADSEITHLFQLIRASHPKLRLADPEAAKRMDQIHRGMARIVDALNPLRNQSSMAHPNDPLLDEPEAMLAINCVRTLLHYLNSRLR